MKINRYILFAFIYFFINSLGLPFGLTYTAILSPLFYWWVITQRKTEILLPFFVCLAPFIIAHFIFGVEVKTYLLSFVNYIAVYIFCQAFYTFLKVCEHPEDILEKILITNTIFCFLASVVYFTPYRELFWMQQTVTVGADAVSRLKLFTYEASYYAMLFVPLFFFYFLQIALRQNKMNAWLLLSMLALPFILSFSIGVIGCFLIAFILTFLVHIRQLTVKKTVLNLLFLITIASVIFFIVLWFAFPENIVFLRLENIFLGKDTSGNGRTTDAFILALKMIVLKSQLWGIGAGQIKILGAEIIRGYYLYDLDYNSFAIPNAVAETLAIFGWIGLSLRLMIELFLFFYTKVWTNYYRLLLYLFIFLYQFTGSFITNIAEYVIWILAFTNAFPSFDVIFKRTKIRPVHSNSLP